MRKLIEVTFMSLDGVIDSPTIVQEAQPYWLEDEEYRKDSHDLLFDADALLLGRKTYEHFADAYPKMANAQPKGQNALVDRMNSIPKYVVSTTLTQTTWNAMLVTGDVAEAVARIKKQPGRQIVKYGTGMLDHLLVKHSLVDEFHIYLFPFIAGSGIHLFEDLADPAHLMLSNARTLENGTLILSYIPRA